MIDEEILKPSREHLAMLRAEIRRQEELAVGDVDRYSHGDKDYARQRWSEFHMTVEPLRREIEAVVKAMVDYYVSQTAPPPIIVPALEQL